MPVSDSFVEALTGDEPSVGTMLESASPFVAEALGYNTPLDFLLVDRQHGPPVLETLVEIVRAADLADLPVMVRVPRDDLSMVTSLLDAGVRGIVIPQVESPATVCEASTHVRYADGRSLGTSTRAARYGAIDREEYVAHVNRDLGLFPMIETTAGYENAAAIAGAEGTTAVVVGPGDLAHSLGVRRGGEAADEAVRDIAETARSAGVATGYFVSSPDDVSRWADEMAFLTYSSDVGILCGHYADVLG